MATPSFLGGKLGHFRVLEKVGEGGMGVVFRAYDENLQREVALKVLRTDPSTDQASKTRMRREALALAQLNHPNIATVYDFESDQGIDFVVLEFVAGESLSQLIRQGPIPVDRLTTIGAEIADAVAQAHANGIVHCDIKPSNIVLSADGHAKVLDFGLARIFSTFGESASAATASGSSGGTLPYMSPEQLSGRADVRSDIYAIGTVLYEMATGHRAFPQEHFADLMQGILNDHPAPPTQVNPALPVEIDTVIGHAMAKDPEHRYQTAKDLRDDLMRLAAGSPVTAKIPKLGVNLGWRSLALIAALLIVAVVTPFLFRRSSTSLVKPTQPKVLAVLPFEPIGGLPEDIALCRGLTEALTANLARESRNYGWEVVPAAEVRSQNVKDADQARRLLGASLVVEGSWQFAGARQVTYGLVDAANRHHIDAAIIGAEEDDYLSLETQVVAGTIRMLGVQNAVLQQTQRVGHRPKDPRAYQYYLRARGYLQAYQESQNIDAAITLLNSATTLDKDFGLAYAGLGEAYWRKYQETKEPKWVARAKEMVAKADQLSSNTAEVQQTLGLIDQGTGQYEKAVVEFEKTITLDGTNDAAYRGLAASYQALGRNTEAEKSYRRAIEVRREYWGGYSALAIFYMNIGRFAEAEPMFRKVIEMVPENARGYSNLGGMYYLKGDYPKARAMFERSIAVQPNYRAYSNLGTIDYFEGRYSSAAQAFEQAIAMDDRDYRVWHNLAASYYWVPESRDKARVAYQRSATMIEAQLKVNPRDAALRMLLADCKAMLDKPAEAESLALRALTLDPTDAEHMFVASEVFERIGKRKEALHWLQQAVEHGFSRVTIEHSPGLKELRTDPQYASIIAKSK